MTQSHPRATYDKYQKQLSFRNTLEPLEQKSKKSSSKDLLWDTRNIISNLPSWVYSDFSEPKTVNECKALISATEYTLRDIDLQIQIRLAELDRKPGASYKEEYQRWLSGALRAKQTNLYLQSAYNYWLILNEDNEVSLEHKLKQVIQIIANDDEDLVDQLTSLL